MPTAPRHDPLSRYRQKRDFRVTPEPDDERPARGRPAAKSADKAAAKAAAKGAKRAAPRRAAKPQALSFVIQKHWASHLHYDFRLELGGVLLSWAVPKGPSYDTKERRMAIHVEDHPLSYGGFEGTIPPRQYGAGEVIVWDNGTWEPEGDPEQGLRDGKLVFRLHGQKLAGLWQLIRTSRDASKREQWLLIKKHDGLERPHSDYDVTVALPDSVLQQPLGLAEERAAGGNGHAAPAAKGASKKAATARAKAAASAVDKDDAAAPGDDAASPDLSRAKKAKLPAELSPQLATLVSATPPGDWIAEAKFDGYRLMARVDKGRVRLITRGGNDWTERLPSLAESLQALGLDNGWLDGEIVVLRDDGAPDFNLLQNAIGHPKRTRHEDIVYFLFDVPFLNGHDLREVPLRERRAVLRALMDGQEDERLRFSEDFAVPPEEMLAAACQMRLEGLILKRPDSAYVSTRSDAWIKLKCQLRQEFVVVGFTDRSDGAKALGSLLLGYYEDGELRYAGRVGTGWSHALAGELHKRLSALEVKTPHFDEATIARSHWARITGRSGGAARWVKPRTVVEVAFAEWTPDGHIRHASFQGEREDKAPKDVGRESAKPADEVKAPKAAAAEKPKPPIKQRAASRAASKAVSTAASKGASAAAEKASTKSSAKASTKGSAKTSTKASTASTSAASGQLRITHPDRVIDPSTGHTKIELVRYYESVLDWMLPHLGRRPVAIVRAPDGIEGELFFQKHVDGDALIVVPDPATLMHLTQMNALEFHTWNAQDDRLDRADRIIFDLDPGEGVSFGAVAEAARITRALLKELGLQAWLKTSGGKGLHVVVPLERRHDHATAKAFSQAVVQHLAATFPKKFSAKSGPRNRVGKIFPDYLRNGEGQTTAAAFSARARPGLGVSMPIDWDELSEVKRADQWTIANARDRLSFQKEDPWKGAGGVKQTLTAGMKLLGLK
ncbi:DNA ligase D [Mitsuaria sp. GD03876]|uniref:DNA ligase D n=1 Tax=Mitsuaria sp. GD03876 TaxID=2975399 RepID=UPI00244C788B|nr:DNA ligase D [Mitsuaria sp. GD03876]MDH0867274.1 DNA ligase D [Mitsuaria sp. GD03876]